MDLASPGIKAVRRVITNIASRVKQNISDLYGVGIRGICEEFLSRLLDSFQR